tara:strand:- start:503 stop:919 length:417 start_codon:yes stop_codon:yes gene_type:complete
MPKKYMNDFQRVKAGNWLENQKAWIATDPSIQVIADAATGELGHRVTGSFVKSYLQETEWFSKMKKQAKSEPATLRDVHHALRLTLDALMEVVEGEPICSREIESTIKQARAVISTTESSQAMQLDLITEDIMRGGHA